MASVKTVTSHILKNLSLSFVIFFTQPSQHSSLDLCQAYLHVISGLISVSIIFFHFWSVIYLKSCSMHFYSYLLLLTTLILLHFNWLFESCIHHVSIMFTASPTSSLIHSLFLLLFILLFKKKFNTSLYFPNVLGYAVFHWRLVGLAEPILLTVTAASNCQYCHCLGVE